MAVPQWSPFISMKFTERIFMPSFMHLYIPGSLFVVAFAVLCITKCKNAQERFLVLVLRLSWIILVWTHTFVYAKVINILLLLKKIQGNKKKPTVPEGKAHMLDVLCTDSNEPQVTI